MLRIEPLFQVAEELGAAEETTGAQFVAVHTFAQRDVHVDLVRQGPRIAIDDVS